MECELELATERLQKLMAQAGLGSRRACEELIRAGRVRVNGFVASLGMRADPDIDDVRVNGTRIHAAQEYVYIMLNKPRGVISDEDVAGKLPRARDIILVAGHLYPVGRLDVQSEGLMLFTNDGDLAHKLTHPSFEHPKTYLVTVEGKPDTRTLTAWRKGILLDDRKTAPAVITVRDSSKAETVLEITIREGRKRQIRRVAAALGHPALRLQRIRLGPLELGKLAKGSWRALTEREVQLLKEVRSAKPMAKHTKVRESASISQPRGRADRGTSRVREQRRQRHP